MLHLKSLLMDMNWFGCSGHIQIWYVIHVYVALASVMIGHDCVSMNID